MHLSPRTIPAYGCIMESRKTQWKDLSPGTKRVITGGGILQLFLLGLAHRDISRRPAEQIRGGKGVWRIATLVNFIGPLAYFAFGRRRA